MFVPLNYSFYIIWSFIFSYFSLYFGFAVLSINLLLPGMDLAKYYGSFKKNKKQKIGLIITIYMVLLISLKRFGIKFLLISILQIITVLTIFIIIKLTRIDSIKRKSLSSADTEE
jgi:hypothetical protein